MSHPLDRSIWHALSTRQSAFAEGTETALRYGTAHAPFAATMDDTPRSLAALHRIVPSCGNLALFTLGALDFPDPLVCVRRAEVAQMVVDSPPLRSGGAALPSTTRWLAAGDVSAMMVLVALTHPGPFAARTLELGRYLGIFADGALVAMAGERISLDGFVEISAVCTHPSHRGKGWAPALIARLARAAIERDEMPFLHAFADNDIALAVYRKLGFSLRAPLHLAIIGRTDGGSAQATRLAAPN